MSVQAVLFDLDGTLLNTLADLAASMNAALARCGFPPHLPEAYRMFVGEGARVLAERVLPEPDRTPERVQEVLGLFMQEYDQRWNDQTAPYDGILPLLDALQQQGCRLAVLSNKPHPFTVLCVGTLLPGVPFDAVRGQQEGTPRKPHPAGALAIAGELGVRPDQCVFLGDSSIDMQTASAAGMIPVGALWGFRDEQELRSSGAQHLIRHPSELLPLLHALATRSHAA